MLWSPDQDRALKAVSDWLKHGGAPVFRLFGYAGTGKTTLARHLAEGVDGQVVFGAFTGKAALVMRDKGCSGASTIHSLIYRPSESDDASPVFSMNRDSVVNDAELVIIDECSMVDEELGRDLLSFGKPVLVLGDPAQLPPVKGGGFFTEEEPDILLTEVHRQARDNPIIAMSMDVREGLELDYGRYDDSRVISRSDLQSEDILSADQVLVGRNITRTRYNRRMRELKDFQGEFPQAGERLICLRNNKKKGLLNGGLWDVQSTGRDKRGRLQMYVLPDPAPPKSKQVRIRVWPHFFQGRQEELSWPERRNSDEFDFGYVLTTHKAQGSQWDDIVLFDESFAFREHRTRWLYTAVTRAAKSITIVR